MKIKYFPETDSLYLDLAERVATDSQENAVGIVLGINAEWLPVGIDIDQASKHLCLEKLNLKGLPFAVEHVAV